MRNYALHLDPAHKKEWLNTVGNTGIGLILQSIKLDYKFVSRCLHLADLDYQFV
jgi:hypothetical protein